MRIQAQSQPYFLPSPARRPTRQSVPHFGAADTPAPKKKVKKHRLMSPFIRAFAWLYTRPKPLAKSINPMLKSEHLHLFEPIQRVELKAVDGVKIQGYWLEAPMPSNKTVVIGHGYFSDFREVLGLAQPLRKRGYHVMLFDFRGHGRSGGKRTSIGYHEGKDVAAAVAYAKKAKALKAYNLFYIGHSMGSASIMATSKSLEKHPEAMNELNTFLDGIVLDVPYAHLDQMAERFVTNPSAMDPGKKRLKVMGKVMALKPFKLGTRFLEGFKDQTQKYLKIDIPLAQMAPHQLMGEGPLVKKPILVTHGTADTITPYEQGVEVYNHLKTLNPATEMLTLPGEDHIRRDWDPAGTGVKSVTAMRTDGYLIDAIDNFCQKITDIKAQDPY